MQYEQALKLWGAQKLQEYQRVTTGGRSKRRIDVDSVYVTMTFSKGFSCCGGRDPDCYCSLAESPRAEVLITGWDDRGDSHSDRIELDDFDFTQVLGEIVEAGGGKLTT